MGNKVITNAIGIENGEHVYYRTSGYGNQTIILIHDNITTSLNWDILLEILPEDKYKLYAIDLRGFGRSSYNNKIESIENLAEDVILFSKIMNFKQYSLIGWGAGSSVALQVSINDPIKVEKIISLNGYSIKGHRINKVNLFKKKKNESVKTKEELIKSCKIINKALNKKRIKTLKKYINKNFYELNMPETQRNDRYIEEIAKQQNYIDFSYALMKFNISNEKSELIEGNNKASTINKPILLLYGEKDKIVSQEIIQFNLKTLGENAELKIIENAGHVPMIDNLEKLVYEIIQFIDQKK